MEVTESWELPEFWEFERPDLPERVFLYFELFDLRI
jgi:hypothetical protein